jgi:hypothetical protein
MRETSGAEYIDVRTGLPARAFRAISPAMLVRVVLWSLLVSLGLGWARPGLALARDREGDPLAYDLRIALFPVAFQAGTSQGHFGSALRAEYQVVRPLDVALFARVPWWNVTGEKSTYGYTLGGTLSIHLDEELEHERLGGTVYPENPPAITGAGTHGAADDMELPISTRLSGPALALDRPRDLTALMYSVQLLRVGFTYTRTVETVRMLGESLYVESKIPLLSVGYGWGTHWNLPSALTGTPEIGYRRFYIDALLTLESVVRQRALFGGPEAMQFQRGNAFPLGARIGMEGSIDALVSSMPGFGFGYTLELGALPAPYAVEGYLLVGLGVALDFITR